MTEAAGSSQQAPSQPRGEQEAERARAQSPLADTPLLGMLALGASIAELVINRIALRTVGEQTPHELLLQLDRWGALVRNLAAVGGLVALATALFGFIRMREAMPLRRRLVIAAFAGLFLPTIVLALVAPPARTTPRTVLFAAGAAHVLTVLIGLVGIRWRAALGARFGVGLLALASLFALGVLVVERAAIGLDLATSTRLTSALRHTGELGYLTAPLAFAVAVIPRVGRIQWGAGALAAIGVAVSLVLAKQYLGEDLAVLLYGAQGVELLLGRATIMYALPLALALGAGVAALAATRATLRQLGAGLLLFSCAGYGPRAPGELLMMVLGMALLSRAVIAMAKHSFAFETAPESRGSASG